METIYNHHIIAILQYYTCMTWILLIVMLLYVVLIGEFAVAHWRIPDYIFKKKKAYTRFSILVPFRNEAANLPQLLECFLQLDYPATCFEVILINDDSRDGYKEVIIDFTVQNPQLNISIIKNVYKSASPKKDALDAGVAKAQYDWIITTDADCCFTANWLLSLNSFIKERNPKMVVAPVAIAAQKPVSFLNAYEQLDFMSLMGATLGGFGMQLPFLCNGANLAYEKEAFMAVNGFQENNHIASGDDHFLLEKFVKHYPKKVTYLKSTQAVVITQQQQQWKSFLAQRLRWASKTASYTFWFAKCVGLFVFMANIITAFLIMYVLIYVTTNFVLDGAAIAFAKAKNISIPLLAILFKWAIDYVLIARTARFYNLQSYLIRYPLVMLVYPFLTVYIAIQSLFFSYEWKGRRFAS
jgi:cellulose synthase/poly-beta-1,6-N-acetylglucosamine synthase-like glycosyltransferase